MEWVVGLLWSVAFTVIIVFLGALNYFLGRSHSDIKISDKKAQTDTATQQQQSNRSTISNNRRKQARNANKKQRSSATATGVRNESLNEDNGLEDEQKTESVPSAIKMDEEEPLIESPVQTTDEDQKQIDEFEDPMEIEEVFIPSHVEDEQKPTIPVKQRRKSKSNSTNSKSTNGYTSTHSISSKEEAILPSKPQASVAPVKQSLLPVPTANNELARISQDNHFKSNGNASSSSIYSYSDQSHLPPRFQQQRQQRFRRRKSPDRGKKLSNSSDSPGRSNEFLPSVSKPKHLNNYNQLEPSLPPSAHNGDSSESDMLIESASTTPSQSTESQLSFKRSDLLHSLSPSSRFLDEFISTFDTASFSSDQLESILNKIMTKHSRNKQDWQRSSPSASSSSKNEKTIENLLDETYRTQAKILAVELQTEKNRVLELAKVNAEMNTAIRQLQQPNNTMTSYQQTILHYQMHIKRLIDENGRLVHQLHAYSVMPVSINELKQQQMILTEQMRQITIRNSNLEKEIADGERASKHAAEIYRKADIQKQERIEQMINDINKYKKIEIDLKTFQEKHLGLERNFNSKLDDITQQRDNLRQSFEELSEKVQNYEQMKIKYEQLLQNPPLTSATDELQQELIEVKAKNDLLRQRNWKIMEQLNKLQAERNPSDSS